MFVLALILAASTCMEMTAESKDFNVVDYGAVGDGITDDSQVIVFQVICTFTALFN